MVSLESDTVGILEVQAIYEAKLERVGIRRTCKRVAFQRVGGYFMAKFFFQGVLTFFL